MHKPTTPAHREAVLRHLAERLLWDAATWGYAVSVVSHAPGHEKNGPLLVVTPVAELVQPSPLIFRTHHG